MAAEILAILVSHRPQRSGPYYLGGPTFALKITLSLIVLEKNVIFHSR